MVLQKRDDLLLPLIFFAWYAIWRVLSIIYFITDFHVTLVQSSSVDIGVKSSIISDANFILEDESQII